ncbi:hypothetical protein GIB67_007112 [Kingdonia uniflora]|uniref:Uncharacterized protein n=1 Tax=Kingdonia uniflora TaxID=39325 RepID=A0A7J7ML75_9MAGN|nr:hypothetical protein GIB67_007112 [Kingdonia uniflora]
MRLQYFASEILTTVVQNLPGLVDENFDQDVVSNVFGKNKNDYIRGFGDMSSAELESTLPFRMKLGNEKVTNTNLKFQSKSLGEQLVFEANVRKQLEERFVLFESRDSPRESQKRRTSDIETSSRSGCSPFVNAYRPSMPVLPRS